MSQPFIFAAVFGAIFAVIFVCLVVFDLRAVNHPADLAVVKTGLFLLFLCGGLAFVCAIVGAIILYVEPMT